MDNGSIKFEYKEGEITGIFINAQLDKIYKKMFNNARRGIRRNPNNIEHGIRIIIFGCFWLEACLNEDIKAFLEHRVQPKKFSKYIWERLKKANILEKFEIVSAFANENQLKNYKSIKSNLKKVFELRNRMAHFKDDDYELKDDDYPEKANFKGDIFFRDFVKSIPEPELFLKLKWPKINEYEMGIIDGKRWLDLVHKNHFSTKLYKSDNGLYEAKLNDN